MTIRFSTLLCLLGMAFASISYAENTQSVAVKTTVVVEKQIGETLMAYGVIDPDPDQVLSLSLSRAGLINRVWVRLGQRVKRGAKLLEVITAPDARMQYLQAQSAVDYASLELERKQRLLKEQLATRTQVDAARKALRDARASLEALHQRGLDRTKETLRAPMDGIITRLDVTQGQRVQADTSAMLIAAEKRLIARLGVEAEDLGSLKPGTPVTLVPVFVADVRVQSQIREVHAMINPRTHLVEVLAPIPEQQVDHLVLGSRLLAYIHLTPHPALMVPRSAVLRDEQGTFVYTVRQSQAQKIRVRTGLERGNEIEITGPLKVGDFVVMLGNYELHDGMSIREIR
ncbi:MAG TPA: efflux RND transporter periplasmic adaptor subunit [Gammaproteobacteria bacterium]|nr:efflux RND transporter periplasmic adaptor subunit [Gammaproteobacteria bacterium]